MDTVSQAPPSPLVQLPPPLDVTRVGEFEVVHVGATPIARYAIGDVTVRRHVMVQLAEAGRLPGQEIAERFGVTPVYVSQLRGRYREAGSSELTARRRGPKGPSKVTPALDARVRGLRAQGLSYHAIAQAVAATTPISYQTVRRLLLVAGGTQWDLPVEEPPAAASLPDAESVEPVAPVGPLLGDIPQGPTRYAGAMLLHVALGQLGFWSVFPWGSSRWALRCGCGRSRASKPRCATTSGVCSACGSRQPSKRCGPACAPWRRASTRPS
jgi:transposase